MKIRIIWPFIPLPVIWFFNVDVIVAPILKKLGMAGITLTLALCLIGSIDLIYHYWAFGRLGKILSHIDPVKENWELAKGFILWMIQGMVKNHNQIRDGEHFIADWVKGHGLSRPFAIGLNPIPVLRTIGIVPAIATCRWINWRIGFCSLLLGNAFHFFFVALFWDWLFKLFHL
jgi:hypothetical protein